MPTTPPRRDFSGKTAIVTGAASGIGRATAREFGRRGADVALFDIDGDGANRVAAELESLGSRAFAYRVDLQHREALGGAIEAVNERFGRIDALANVAGIYPRAHVQDVTVEYWDRMIGVNLRGVFFCCQDALRVMEAQGSGSIVNVASGAAFRPIAGLSVYAAAKAGLVGMSRVLALEYARKGIRVNVVAPGHTSADVESTDGSTADRAAEWTTADDLVPGRYMAPDESANAIVWLCSDEATGVNGAIVNVNGGNYMP